MAVTEHLIIRRTLRQVNIIEQKYFIFASTVAMKQQTDGPKHHIIEVDHFRQV